VGVTAMRRVERVASGQCRGRWRRRRGQPPTSLGRAEGGDPSHRVRARSDGRTAGRATVIRCRVRGAHAACFAFGSLSVASKFRGAAPFCFLSRGLWRRGRQRQRARQEPGRVQRVCKLLTARASSGQRPHGAPPPFFFYQRRRCAESERGRAALRSPCSYVFLSCRGGGPRCGFGVVPSQPHHRRQWRTACAVSCAPSEAAVAVAAATPGLLPRRRHAPMSPSNAGARPSAPAVVTTTATMTTRPVRLPACRSASRRPTWTGWAKRSAWMGALTPVPRHLRALSA